jgi:hypothetical protein
MATCNHCYRSVMFKQDGSCPACGKHQDQGAPVSPDKTLVIIRVDQPLPSCCLLCGSATERRRRMVFWYDVAEIDSLLSKVLSRIPGNHLRKAHRASLPICEACEEESKGVRPFSVRFGIDYTMVAHRNFRVKYEALNGPPEYEPT